jgi:hypothetical protein
MILPKISKQQIRILYFLYKFRYLHTYHFQKLLLHKDPQRTQEWLKNMRELGFIRLYKEPKSFKDHATPYVYQLGLKARHILKNDPECNMNVLHNVYRKEDYSEAFIDRCLTIADLYLFLQSQTEKNEELNFFTESELVNYPYFPKTDHGAGAYITLTKDTIIRNYLLEYFGRDITPGELRYRFKKYLKYVDSGVWKANTNGEAFPTLLFVFALPRRKNYIRIYARSVLDKKIDENIELFVTTKDNIRNNKKNVWERVSI